MPLVRIDLLEGRSAEDVAAIGQAVHDALVEKKKALYAALTRNLAARAGLRPEDVFVNLLEVPRENWSFGNGEAQYAR